MTKEDIHFDLTKNDDLFYIKLLIDCNKVCYNKQCIKDETYQTAMEVVFNTIRIFSAHFVHLGRGTGAIEM